MVADSVDKGMETSGSANVTNYPMCLEISGSLNNLIADSGLVVKKCSPNNQKMFYSKKSGLFEKNLKLSFV